MAAALPRTSFLDHPATRVVALLIAAALAFTIWWTWSHADGQLTAQPQPIGAVASDNPALAECRRTRHAAIDDMRANDIITADQVTEYKARANELCEEMTRTTRQ